MQVFGSAAGCVLDNAAVQRAMEAFGPKCLEYLAKSQGKRACSSMNQQRGFVTAVLDPHRKVPVSVELSELNVEGVKTNKEIEKRIADEPMYLAYRGIGASTMMFSTETIEPVPAGIDFNSTMELMGPNDTVVETTEWERWKHSLFTYLFQSRQKGSVTAQHTIMDIAAMTSNLANSFVMETLQLLSSGLCKSNLNSMLTANNLFTKVLGPSLLPMFNIMSTAEQSDMAKAVVKAMTTGTNNVFSAMIHSLWDINEGAPAKPMKKLSCKEQNVSAWLNQDNAVTYFLFDGQRQASQRFMIPCFFDDESFTVTLLREMLTPKGQLLYSSADPSNLDSYGNSIVGDAGVSDAESLGTLMAGLFSKQEAGRFWKKNPKEPWHALLLSAPLLDTHQIGTDYFSEYATIKSQMSYLIIDAMEKQLNADCSKTHTYTKNVNRLFSGKPDILGLFNGFSQNVTLTTAENYLFSLQPGQKLQFSSRNLQDDSVDYAFVPFLPDDLLEWKHQAHHSAAGFRRGFDAFVAMYKGQLHAVDWLCRMLMDDCNPVYLFPFEFLQYARWQYNGVTPESIQKVVIKTLEAQNMTGPLTR
jgi:hypothetical protein